MPISALSFAVGFLSGVGMTTIIASLLLTLQSRHHNQAATEQREAFTREVKDSILEAALHGMGGPINTGGPGETFDYLGM